MSFETNPSPNTPMQIDTGTYSISQGNDVVGYVTSTIEVEFWVLRTATPTYSWPTGPVGNGTTCTYTNVSEETFETLEEFVTWVETTTGWTSTDFQTVESQCTIAQTS